MAGRRICAEYYQRYDRKVVYVISLATDADTGEESVIWTTCPFTDVPRYYTSSKKSFCAFVEVNGERMAQYRRLVNMKISGEAVERLMEEGFRGPVRKRPIYSQVRRCPSAEPWQRGLSGKNSSLPWLVYCKNGTRRREHTDCGNQHESKNNPTSNGAPAIKQTLRFSIKCMS